MSVPITPAAQATKSFYFNFQTGEEDVEEATDESFVEDAADIDARRMAMKAAEGLLS